MKNRTPTEELSLGGKVLRKAANVNDPESIMDKVRWPFSLNAWRYWVTLTLIIVAGDHAGLWDVDSVFAGGEPNVKDLAVIVGSAMAFLTAIAKKQPGDK